MREPMDAVTDPLIDIVTFKKSSQVGGTELLNNTICYHIDQDPASMMLIQPTVELAKKYSKRILDPVLRDNEYLGDISMTKSRDKNNSIQSKTFPGGFLELVGANAPSGLAMLPVRIMLMDEVDRYPPSAGDEGDPRSLAQKRTETFWNSKIVEVSTPTIAGLSNISEGYEASDQRHYYVPCPHCKYKQLLIFGPRSQYADLANGFLKFDDINGSWAYYVCGNCQKPIEESFKNIMVRNGEWRPHNMKAVRHAGFHINALYSPWSSWLKLVNKFLTSKHNRFKLQTFINTYLGEDFKDKETYELETEKLSERQEEYTTTAIPDGVLIMTMGVDVQENRIEAEVWGWGENEEGWFIDRRVITGKPTDDTTWDFLDGYIDETTKWTYANGYPCQLWKYGGVIAIGIDSGAYTKSVYNYVKRHRGRRVYATKGKGGFGEPIIKNAYLHKKRQVPLIIVGVDTAKEEIYAKLEQELGPGTMHFNKNCDQEYFNQLTSEVKVIEPTKQGYKRKVWKLKEGFNNEVLDCVVINLAMHELLKPPMQRIRKQLDNRMANFRKSSDKAEGKTTGPDASPSKTKKKKSSKNWVTGW